MGPCIDENFFYSPWNVITTYSHLLEYNWSKNNYRHIGHNQLSSYQLVESLFIPKNRAHPSSNRHIGQGLDAAHPAQTGPWYPFPCICITFFKTMLQYKSKVSEGTINESGEISYFQTHGLWMGAKKKTNRHQIEPVPFWLLILLSAGSLSQGPPFILL